MPQKGESASFLLHFYCNIQAGLPLPPPVLPPSRSSPPPLLRRESWTGEVSTQEPKLSTSSESRRQRATAGEREQRRSRGGRPAQPQRQRQRGLISQEGPRLWAPQPPRLPATALPNAPGRPERTKRLCGATGPGTAAAIGRRRPLCPVAGPASAQRAARRGSAEGAGSPRRRPPALRLCAALSRAPRNPLAPERSGQPRPPPARAVSRHCSPTPEAERKSEGAGAGKEAARPGRWNARSEGARSRTGGLSASIKPPGSGPQLGRRARNLKTLCAPGFPQPSPSPCESWGTPCPRAPSIRGKTLTRGAQMCETFYCESGQTSQISEPYIRASWDTAAPSQRQHAEQCPTDV
ncbi:paired box protein Pax-6 isoform X5 [Bubalus kerabau]|uniref:paired box protein Pax-6 isoform X5 n=1 Tax=Bubalus carabanensis TaxID=3119969 RepID=UPI00244E70C9|nr:paired box protein Pax-6 isoform X5 [Bubalus carabanensis]